jgi:hypothetical protein
VDPIPDPLLLRKSGSAGNLTKDVWIKELGKALERLNSFASLEFSSVS